MVGEKIYSKTLTGASISIVSADGITQLSILCTTATPGSFTGTGIITDGLSGAVSIAENTSVTLGTSSGFPIESLVVTAPAGCILLLTGSIG
jgi:hypothetical protein